MCFHFYKRLLGALKKSDPVAMETDRSLQMARHVLLVWNGLAEHFMRPRGWLNTPSCSAEQQERWCPFKTKACSWDSLHRSVRPQWSCHRLNLAGRTVSIKLDGVLNSVSVGEGVHDSYLDNQQYLFIRWCSGEPRLQLSLAGWAPAYLCYALLVINI